MSKFRGGLLKLECNEGRYNNVPFNERICLLFKRDIETEYNFLLVCPKMSQIMLKYISPLWFTYPSLDKFVQLCTSKSSHIINNISQCVFSAMTFRVQYLRDINE